ncbi:MAG: ComEC/Rec2 family competence protein [Alphaproteobacteria bacterium]|nr:ComEC/Rec2 family competence protein [Alphaproteobacteria bacterium]
MFSKLSIIKPFIDAFIQERERWFLWLPVFMACGIGLYFSWGFEPALWLCLTATGISALLVAVFRQHSALPALLALLAFTSGHLAAKIETLMITQPMLSAPIERAEVTGRVMVINHLPDGYRLWLEDVQIEGILQKDTPRKIRVKVKTQSDIPRPGDWVVLRASLFPLSRPAEPGAFDFRRFAFFQGFGATGYTLAPWRKAIGQPPDLMQRIALFFERVRVSINEKLVAEGKDRNMAVASALISGDQSTIDKSTMQAMRVSGISHILSVSGLHITLVAGIVFFTLRALMALFPWVTLQLPIKKIAAFFALLAAMFYTFMCAAPIPAVRSLLMSSLILIAVMVDRRALSMRLVAFAALVSLLLSPTSLFDPSFQLSFGAVMALIAAFEKNEIVWLRHFRNEGWIGKLRLWFLASIATSVIATIATLPFILYYFQQINWYGVITNLIAVPLSTFIIMPMAVITVLAMPFGLQHWPIVIMNTGIKWMIDSAEFVSNWPGAATYHPAMPMAALLLVTLGGLWVCLWRKRWRFLGIIPFALGSLAFLITPRPDVFVADDGISVAVRLEQNRLAVRSKSLEDFTVQTWLQRNGKRPGDFTQMVNWFDMMDRGGEEPIKCTGTTCIFTKESKSIAFPMNRDDVPDLCGKVDLIIAPSSATPCPDRTIVPQMAEQRGAYTLFISNSGIRIEHIDLNEARPWSSALVAAQ